MASRIPLARSRFKPGDPVEVTLDQEGYVGAWYEARVISATRDHRYTVVYDGLLDDIDPSRNLIETVDANHIRPRPPPFALHQFVEAFHNDGWWVGVISAVHDTGRRYTVCFDEEESEYTAEMLRPHMDWISGEWIVPEQKAPEWEEPPEMIEMILPNLPFL